MDRFGAVSQGRPSSRGSPLSTGAASAIKSDLKPHAGITPLWKGRGRRCPPATSNVGSHLDLTLREHIYVAHDGVDRLRSALSNVPIT